MLGSKLIIKSENPITIQPISKTIECDDGRVEKGIDVFTHCKIVGLVAKQLLSIYPISITKIIFPSGVDFIAACHDVGKISPDFQKMIHQFLSEVDSCKFPELEDANPERAKRKENSFHAKVSQATLKSLFEEKNEYIPWIAGIHHGFKPNSVPCAESSYGGQPWSERRHLLVQSLKEYFHLSDSQLPNISSFEHANAVAGLVTVSDWIGSGGDFSQLSIRANLSDEQLAEMAQKAVCDAGFEKSQIIKGLSFENIFGFSPIPVQKKFIENVNAPGIYILEAPMGVGKTEAALYAAYTLLSQETATGLYFALPTQLTSNKIHDRVNDFLLKICDSASQNNKAKLLHSAAWLTQSVFGEDADSGGSWFDTSKRGILAPFAVGTIDQALMAVMNVKHSSVRAFGLVGKVVILDEVHSYDSFTGTIMNDLISCLYKNGCTVIVLSATLTAQQKRNILNIPNAYPVSTAYPLITALSFDAQTSPPESAPIVEVSVESEKTRIVKILHEQNDQTAIDLVIEKAELGEQVLWIENTIADAQNVFQQLSCRVDHSQIECGLIHSRYIKSQRQSKEDIWVSMYGKASGEKRYQKGRILVGTQVLEQSIDIDADFMVTRICPTDMLLQRIGRLWRHSKFDCIRPVNSKQQILILSPLYNDALLSNKPFGKSSNVYSEYVLCRSLEIWEPLTLITLPDDIRSLLEKTYAEHEETGHLQKLKTELINLREKLRRLALIGLSTEINTLPETQAQTRYSEMDTTDVLLVRSIAKSSDNHILRFLDETELIVPSKCHNVKQKREIAGTIMQNTVRVSEYLAPKSDYQIDWLKPYVYIGGKDDGENPFRIAQVEKDDHVASLMGSVANDKYKLWYNSNTGYKSDKGGNQ